MVATTWNSGDKTGNVTLSGGNLTAAMTSAAYGGVRTTVSFSGKSYYEIIVRTVPSTSIGIGWANAAASLSTYTGQDKNSWSYLFYTTVSNILFNNGSLLSTGEAAQQFSTICVAFDDSALFGWVKINNSHWNGSSTADPATGTGGFSIATMNAGPYFPVFNSNVNNASVIANFGATDFGYPVPSGFSSFDSNAQAYNASSKFLGYADLIPPQTAADASKFIGYSELAPTQTAADASKLLGYSELAPNQNAAVSSKLVTYAVLSSNPSSARNQGYVIG